MLKKLIILSSVSLFLHGSGGKPAQVDSQTQLKSAEEALITQPKKTEQVTNSVLSVVTQAKPIQDIITGYINCWSHAKDILFSTIFAPTLRVTAIEHAYSRDGKDLLFAVSTYPYEIALYDVALQHQKIKFRGDQSLYPLKIRYSIDGQYVVTFSSNVIHVRDANTLNVIKTIEYSSIEDVQFFKDSQYLIVSIQTAQNQSRFYYCKWNEKNIKFTLPLVGNKKTAFRVLISPSGNHITEAPAHTGSFVVWDLKTGKKIASRMICEKSMNSLTNIAYSPSGVYFAAAAPDKHSICIYDTKIYSEVAQLDFANLKAQSCSLFFAFSPNDKYLAFATMDQVCIYDIKNKKIIFTHKVENENWVQSLAYHPNGTSFTACLKDRISLFEPPTLE